MMNIPVINSVSNRLSLRPPQRDSLEALAGSISLSEGEMLNHNRDVTALLEVLKAKFPKLEDFEREFPSLCFALATGVGKTRLMGAFVSYLYLAHGIKNFFVLAPNLTIYDKLIDDFTPGTAKYVFKGIAEFANQSPEVITGDNYEERGRNLSLLSGVVINIFNISKINSEVRGGKAPRIKRLSEYLGDSYFNYLSKLPDLVLLMDESHRYRASAGVRALNELNPLFGLELTATPFVESARGAIPFKNVVVDYPLALAMDDGFVKEPAVVTQRDFVASNYNREEIERIKLMDGIRLHENTKVELQTYAHENGVALVKPFMLVIARDTTHASQLLETMESEKFFDGNYQGKIIQVDSSRKGKAEEEMIRRLLAVESVDEPTEIVIHVNMLKEGWDVTNLYTIVPLRAANARTLIEQSIGRGLRLPYGRRTGVAAVDRLSIVAHDKFQEIVDEANNPENPLRLKQIILERPEDDERITSVQVVSNLETAITGRTASNIPDTNYTSDKVIKPIFNGVGEQEAAKAVYKAIQQFQRKPEQASVSQDLRSSTLQEALLQEVSENLTGDQQALFVDDEKVNLQEIVNKTVDLFIDKTIDIPRILITPKDEVNCGYTPFTLDLSGLNLQPSERDLVSHSLQTNKQIMPVVAQVDVSEERPENYIVNALTDFNDISYDDHADLLYDLAGQVVLHLKAYLSDDEVDNVLDTNRQLLARTIHAQMQGHYWEDDSEYVVEVSSGFVPLKESAYTISAGRKVRSFRETVTEKSKIKQMLFGGFERCLYPLQKFDSDTERRFSVILERDAIKWFKPVKGQFNLYYKDDLRHPDYIPDFVAETEDVVLMVETKSMSELETPQVMAKVQAGVNWCNNASDYLLKHSGKRWIYLLIPHTEVLEHNTLSSYIQRFSQT